MQECCVFSWFCFGLSLEVAAITLSPYCISQNSVISSHLTARKAEGWSQTKSKYSSSLYSSWVVLLEAEDGLWRWIPQKIFSKPLVVAVWPLALNLVVSISSHWVGNKWLTISTLSENTCNLWNNCTGLWSTGILSLLLTAVLEVKHCFVSEKMKAWQDSFLYWTDALSACLYQTVCWPWDPRGEQGVHEPCP